jgi:PPOX class probable F420-dependent enzyme
VTTRHGWARERFGAAQVARLASVTPAGRPHLVAIVFVVVADTIYTAVDAKPKRTTNLTRLRNIRENPQVSVLVDHYAENWGELWWVRADGSARIVDIAEPEGQDAVSRLSDRYQQYREQPIPPGPVIAVDVGTWSAWSATEPA